MAVAAVSRDTVRSFSPPAATPVTVSVTATLLLAAGPYDGGGASIWHGQRVRVGFRGAPSRTRCVFPSFGPCPRPAKWSAVLEAT